MKAVGYYTPGDLDRDDALIDLELPRSEVGPSDLLVRVAAVAVNPVDTKIRRNRAPEQGQAGVLGWDAVGVVEAVGSQVSGFANGDRVYYAGAINRAGSNAEFQVVSLASLASSAARLPPTCPAPRMMIFIRRSLFPQQCSPLQQVCRQS